MSEELCEGHRVQHIRDGLVGTIDAVERPCGETSLVQTYRVKWDNGSFESRIDPSEIAAAPSM